MAPLLRARGSRMSSNDEELLIVEQLDKLDEWRPPIEPAVDADNDKVLDVRDSNDPHL